MIRPTFAGTHIVTADVPRLARFYEAVLQQPPAGSEEYVEFRVRDVRLAICSQCAVDMYAPKSARPARNRSLILDFAVDDVDAERRRLEALVSTFVLEPVTQPWGSRSMLFRDPDGNLIHFYAHTDVNKSH